MLGQSLMSLLGVELRVPDYTTLSRRQRTLEVYIPRCCAGEPLHLVVDSTGMSVLREKDLLQQGTLRGKKPN